MLRGLPGPVQGGGGARAVQAGQGGGDLGGAVGRQAEPAGDPGRVLARRRPSAPSGCTVGSTPELAQHGHARRRRSRTVAGAARGSAPRAGPARPSGARPASRRPRRGGPPRSARAGTAAGRRRCAARGGRPRRRPGRPRRPTSGQRPSTVRCPDAAGPGGGGERVQHVLLRSTPITGSAGGTSANAAAPPPQPTSSTEPPAPSSASAGPPGRGVGGVAGAVKSAAGKPHGSASARARISGGIPRPDCSSAHRAAALPPPARLAVPTDERAVRAFRGPGHSAHSGGGQPGMRCRPGHDPDPARWADDCRRRQRAAPMRPGRR